MAAFFLFFKFILFTLAASGLSCGMWDPRCGMRDLSLWRTGSRAWAQ